MNDSIEASTCANGGCLCGGVRYECRTPMRAVVNCHCRMCRRTHGHVAAYSAVAKAGLVLTNTLGLRWYASSTDARRGFCSRCGASLFWEHAHDDHVAISAGTLDSPTHLTTVGHVFVADAGDYYTICDGLRRFAGSMRTP